MKSTFAHVALVAALSTVSVTGLATTAHAAAPDSAAATPADPVIAQLKKCETLKCPAVKTLIGLKDGVWPRIKEGLAAPDEMTRFWSLGVLTEIPTLKARDAVAAMLADKKIRIRAAAAYVLGAMKDKSVSPHLVKALADKDLNVRFSAAMALGRVKDPATVKPLTVATRDSDEEVRAYACLALGDMGIKTVVPTLMERLDQDLHPKVRGFAAMSLSKVADKRALPLLRKRLNEETDAKAFAAAVFALGELGGTSELLLLKRVEGSLAKHRVKAIGTSADVAEYVADAIDKLRATRFETLGLSVALPEGFKVGTTAGNKVTLVAAAKVPTASVLGSLERFPKSGKSAAVLAGKSHTALNFGEYKVLRTTSIATEGVHTVAYYFDHADGPLAVTFTVPTNSDIKTLDRAVRSLRFL